MRLNTKGGPWSNREDELLKAGISKYGFHSWEKIADLLGKTKSPQQCRSRWEEYLDPQINKGEWTEAEETQLVTLQELFGDRWDVISAQIPGRRWWQCQKHFDDLTAIMEEIKMKRAAHAGEGGEGERATANQIIAELKLRRQTQGGGGSSAAGFELSYETRAARPDSIDDENAAEEIARGRLANTVGKKGERAARHRMLDESAFLTTLESRKEAIESGTGSSALNKKIKNAIHEDLMGRGTVDDDDEEFQAVEVRQGAAARQKKTTNLVLFSSKQLDKRESQGVENRSGVDLSQLDVLAADGNKGIRSQGTSTGSLASLFAMLPPEEDVAPNQHHLAPVPETLGSGAQEAKTKTEQREEKFELSSVFDVKESYLSNAAQLIADSLTNAPDESIPAHYLAAAREEIQRVLELMAAGGAAPTLSNTVLEKCSHAPEAEVSTISASKEIEAFVAATEEFYFPDCRKRGREIDPSTLSVIHEIDEERVKGEKLRRALFFYDQVCSAAEDSEMKRRLDAVNASITLLLDEECCLQELYEKRNVLAVKVR